MPIESKGSKAVEDSSKITATMFAIAVVLKTLIVRAHRTIGLSVGELVKAYFEDCLTLEEAVLSAHAYITLFHSRGIVEPNNKVIDIIYLFTHSSSKPISHILVSLLLIVHILWEPFSL